MAIDFLEAGRQATRPPLPGRPRFGSSSIKLLRQGPVSLQAAAAAFAQRPRVDQVVLQVRASGIRREIS